jgi:hypothetical protein
MDSDVKKLKKLILLMRKQGVLSLKASPFEITLSPLALQVTDEVKTPAQPSDTDPTIDVPSYSEDDLLFWSAPGIPQEAQ